MAEDTESIESADSAPVSDEKMFTQEELNRLVGNARAKERKKYADYDELHATIEALQAKVNSMEQQRETEKQREKWITEVSKDSGVPDDVLKLITADSQDDLKDKAQSISAHFKKDPLPAVPGDGKKPEGVQTDANRKLLHDLLGEDKS